MAGFSDCRADPAMLARARRGDMKAHEVLYASYGTPVYTLGVRMLGEPALAEEVLQDTCIEVIRNLADFREDDAFGGWVKRIAVNKCLAHLRSAWHRKAQSLEPAGDDAPALQPASGDDPASAVGDGQALERALAELSPTARAVVWLYDVEGYTHQEIADLMGKTVSFSKSQLSRAHERLRTLLGEEQEVSVCTPLPSSC
ncbi:MAG: RNA polymerase sigma factor [Gammaproteobacteria bacterium]